MIFCAAGNPRLARIAIENGMKYGAQLPNTVYHRPHFVDQDWRRPNRERYIAALEQYKPSIATVLDLESEDQLPEVMEWAHEAAEHVQQAVIIIPKVQGIVAHLPRTIAGKSVRLGYSVPTRYGGTELPLWDFTGWPVHLLGGSPQAQLRIASYLDVRSADCNAHVNAAQKGTIWDGQWKQTDDTAPEFFYRCFGAACRNIVAAWRNLQETPR